MHGNRSDRGRCFPFSSVFEVEFALFCTILYWCFSPTAGWLHLLYFFPTSVPLPQLALGCSFMHRLLFCFPPTVTQRQFKQPSWNNFLSLSSPQFLPQLFGKGGESVIQWAIPQAEWAVSDIQQLSLHCWCRVGRCPGQWPAGHTLRPYLGYSPGSSQPAFLSSTQPGAYPQTTVFTNCLSILEICPHENTHISLESQQTLCLSFTPNVLTAISTPFPLSYFQNLSYFDAEKNVGLYFLTQNFASPAPF